jgi:hypothetical protein
MPPDAEVLLAPQPVKESFSREYVHELREENKSSRLKVQEAEAAARAATEAATNAKAEAEAKSTESHKAADQRVIRAELKLVAKDAGMLDLDDLKLLDLSGMKIDENGEVIGAAELIKKFKEAKPHKFDEVKSTSSTEKTPKKEDVKEKRVSEMTPEERNFEAKRRGFKV